MEVKTYNIEKRENKWILNKIEYLYYPDIIHCKSVQTVVYLYLYNNANTLCFQHTHQVDDRQPKFESVTKLEYNKYDTRFNVIFFLFFLFLKKQLNLINTVFFIYESPCIVLCKSKMFIIKTHAHQLFLAPKF